MNGRILFCSHLEWSRHLGATKVQLELGDAMSRQGWACTYFGPNDLGMKGTLADFEPRYAAALRDVLHKRSADFDVVDFGHHQLPFDRSLFSPTTLMVARSVLLIYHSESIRLPRHRTARSITRQLIYGRRDRRRLRQRVRDADATIAGADLVNVSNRHDRAELLRRGVSADKIMLLPYGLSQARRVELAVAPVDRPRNVPPVVGFVGTFDPRKGELEMPTIWSEVIARVPTARLRLIGTRGLRPDAETVRQQFPSALRGSLDIIPAFEPADLPRLLAECDVGLFPSHFEGFPFGLLEMLAAALPVVAYDAPGPPEMLPSQWLVPCGDASAAAAKLIDMLSSTPDKWRELRRLAVSRADRFDWDAIAAETIRHYVERLHRLRTAALPSVMI